MYPYDSSEINQDLIKKMMSFSPGVTQNHEEHTVKVNGINGANALPLGPNSDKLALDQNEPIVWFIQTDGAGYKTVTGYDISLHKEVKQEDVMKSINDRLTKLEEDMKYVKSNNRSNDERTNKQRNISDASASSGSRSNDKG